MLGISLGEQSLLVAEVHASASRPQVIRVGELRYAADAGLQQPEALGIALARYLKEKGSDSHSAVFGVPVRWIVSKRKEVPNADDRVLIETLRLQAEGEFSPELTNLVYDYSGRSPSTGAGAADAGSVLLMALPGRYIDLITKLAEAARVKVRAIMPSGVALAAAPQSKAAMVLMGQGGIEFIAQTGGHARALRYVGAAAAPAPILAGELRRAVAAASPDSLASTNGHPRPELTVWNDSAADDGTLRALGEGVGLAIHRGALAELNVDTAPAVNGAQSFAAPVALALAGLTGGPAVIDFAHSRLAAPIKRRVERRTVLIIAVAAAVLLGFGSWFFTLHARQSKLDAMTAALAKTKSQRDAASAEIRRIEFAQHWHGANPRFLACLRDLTLASPRPGRLYGTSLTIHEDSKRPNELMATFSGKANDEMDIEALEKKLVAAGPFEEVTGLRTESRESGPGGREVSFTISFYYTPQP